MGIIPRQSLVVTRFSGGSYVDGRYVKGSTSTVNIKANIQPFKTMEDKMKSLPEARHDSDAFRLYTDSEMFGTRKQKNSDPPIKADQVDLPNDNGTSTYEVFSVARWQNGVRSHFKAVVYKIDT